MAQEGTELLPRFRDRAFGLGPVSGAQGAERLRVSLDASLGIPGLPGTASGQATLVTGENAAAWSGRHLHGYPGPALRAWLDARPNLFVWGPSVLLNRYGGGGPPTGRESVLRYVARGAGALVGEPRAQGLQLTHADAGFLTAGLHRAEAVGERIVRGAQHLARDLAVFETDLLDHAGHERDPQRRLERTREALQHLDGVLVGCVGALGAGESLVVTSDHGNIEAPATRGHTRSAVPLWAVGPIARRSPGTEAGLAAFAPWLRAYLGDRVF